MLEAVFAQLRFAASIMFGVRFNLKSLDRLITSLQETRHEFGTLSHEASELLTIPSLDDETRREIQLRRFRTQAVRAARKTVYYAPVFATLGLDPTRLRYEDIQRVPLTTKTTVRERSDDLIVCDATPYLRSATTGTTGRSTGVCFSSYEMRTLAALTTIHYLINGQVTNKDIVQNCLSSRSSAGNPGMVHTCERLGALLFPIGITDPAQALSLLREQRRIPGKKERVSILVTYPSYLGQLVEEGLRLGYGPDDFGLERIMSGGELVTAGLRRRCAALFGPVAFSEGYAMTEILPLGGNLCNQGHLHYEISEGLMEVIDPDTGRPAAPGEPGTLVATPFPPYRETTILLRYDTQDMVRTIAGPLTCSMATMPATTNILGKQSLCVRHDQGWTFPRDVVEALEAVPEVPLPARYGFWAVPGGVALDVLVREITPAAYTQIVASLTAHGVLVQELELTTNRTEIRQPYPLRCDLKESTFASAPPPAHPIRESATEVRP